MNKKELLNVLHDANLSNDPVQLNQLIIIGKTISNVAENKLRTMETKRRLEEFVKNEAIKDYKKKEGTDV